MLSTRRVSNLHFWPPTPPKNHVLDPRGGGTTYIFLPPTSPYKNVSYIFWPPPRQQGVKGVGIVFQVLVPWCHTSHQWHLHMQRSWFSNHMQGLPSWSFAASYGLRAAEVLFSLHRSHIDSIHLRRQCRSHHHHSHGETFLGSSWGSSSMKDHSSATTWRGALASSIDQLERLPKTASHPFTHGVLPVGAVSTGLLYISLLSLEGRI